jgi:hypothetical protein
VKIPKPDNLLIARAQAKAGRDVHRINQLLQRYQSNLEVARMKFDRGDTPGATEKLKRAELHERAIRSFVSGVPLDVVLDTFGIRAA